MRFCRKCGAELPADAQFCSRCGTAVVPAAADGSERLSVPPQPASSARTARGQTTNRHSQRPAAASRWWVTPAVIVGLVILAWVVVMGLPFGSDDQPRAAAAPPTETVGEAPAPPNSATLVEVPAGDVGETFDVATTTTASPPMATTPATATSTPPGATGLPPASGGTQPAPTTTGPPATATTPRPTPTQRPAPATPRPQPPPIRAPAPAPVPVDPRPEPAAEISGDDAVSAVRAYVTSTRFYPVANDCLRVENAGYRNVGFNLQVWDTCAGGGSRLLGRWRVDSRTREVFVQRDGRYLRP